MIHFNRSSGVVSFVNKKKTTFEKLTTLTLLLGLEFNVQNQVEIIHSHHRKSLVKNWTI